MQFTFSSLLTSLFFLYSIFLFKRLFRMKYCYIIHVLAPHILPLICITCITYLICPSLCLSPSLFLRSAYSPLSLKTVFSSVYLKLCPLFISHATPRWAGGRREGAAALFFLNASCVCALIEYKCKLMMQK